MRKKDKFIQNNICVYFVMIFRHYEHNRHKILASYDNFNKPALVALELNANSIDGTEINVIKIASAYGKDRNLQSFLDKSEIIYVNPNKEKTQSWLSINRLQLPLGITNFEFNNTNISQSDNDVKHKARLLIQSKAFKTHIENKG